MLDGSLRGFCPEGGFRRDDCPRNKREVRLSHHGWCEVVFGPNKQEKKGDGIGILEGLCVLRVMKDEKE